VDVAAFLPTIHGMRAIETICRLALPGVDPEQEAQAELADVDGVVAVAGAAAFLAALPPTRWGMSSQRRTPWLASRLAAAGPPVLTMMVTAEDVTNGKPAPDGFLLGASRLGAAAEDCLVFEDARAGIQAGMAAGAHIVVVAAAPHQRVVARFFKLYCHQRLPSASTIRFDG
jgi:mannitol-1-/sugar-/sorbitol-6-phosphatase